MARDIKTGVSLPVPEEVPVNSAAKESLPPGFRFHPTDEELVSYYLKKKVLGKPYFDAIGEVEIYKHKPSDLKVYSKLKTRDKEWYFFSTLDKKSKTGTSYNRATKEGFWKQTGKDREVHGRDQSLIGIMKILVFHKGRAPDGIRTNWVIHEYHRLVENQTNWNKPPQQKYVLCRLFLKNDIGQCTGNRYGPFLKDEWDDDDADVGTTMFMEDHAPIVVDDNDNNNEIEQETNQTQRKYLFDLNELPREFDDSITEYPHNKEAPLPSNGNSSQTNQDHEKPKYSKTEQNEP